MASDQVYLPTWSVVNGQDDIVWYPAEKQADGTWAYTVDLRKHHTAGQYMIHVYGRNEQGGELHLLTNTTAYVKRAILPDDPYVTVELSADCRTMKLTVQKRLQVRAGLPARLERDQRTGRPDLVHGPADCGRTLGVYGGYDGPSFCRNILCARIWRKRR